MSVECVALIIRWAIKALKWEVSWGAFHLSLVMAHDKPLMVVEEKVMMCERWIIEQGDEKQITSNEAADDVGVRHVINKECFIVNA